MLIKLLLSVKRDSHHKIKPIQKIWKRTSAESKWEINQKMT